MSLTRSRGSRMRKFCQNSLTKKFFLLERSERSRAKHEAKFLSARTNKTACAFCASDYFCNFSPHLSPVLSPCAPKSYPQKCGFYSNPCPFLASITTNSDFWAHGDKSRTPPARERQGAWRVVRGVRSSGKGETLTGWVLGRFNAQNANKRVSHAL